jgi:hypothetical protein
LTARDDLARLVTLVRSHAAEIDAADRDDDLAEWLYWRWYAASGDIAATGEPQPFDRLGGALNALIDRVGPWESDWVVLSLGTDGSVLAGRGGLQRLVSPGRFASVDRPGLPPVPGERVWVPPLIGFVDAATGQWAAQSPQAPDGALRRFYVNVSSAGVGFVMLAIVTLLHQRGTQFSMKCPGADNGFGRADTLVLYTRRDDAEPLEEALVAAVHATGTTLRDGQPALTRRLANGMATADDPGDGQSYGQSRCALLAKVVSEHRHDRALPERLTAALVQAGIDPTEPWRQPS